MASEILIKGMVFQRCVDVIKNDISDPGYATENISLGKLLLKEQANSAGLVRKAKQTITHDTKKSGTDGKSYKTRALKCKTFRRHKLYNC